MKAYERFLKYAKIHTTSDESSGAHPSSPIQFDLAHCLVDELKELGISAACDERCYVYATIPATAGCENVPAIGFIAHMDTSPDFCGENVSPRIIENFDGEDVVLGAGRVLKRADFPHLAAFKGRTLIVTDGNTLLGADDKAGIAEIMTLAATLIEQKLPHGKICIAFTPDEEIGEGADHFDVARFGADFAYTADGDIEGGIEYENFNAAGATFEINGFNIHPGSAKGKMINASLVAMEINSLLPADEVPSKTEGYEGFFHLTDMAGCVEHATVKYIIRDHSAESFAKRCETVRQIEKQLNATYGAGTVILTLTEQYRNMEEKIRPCFHVIETAKQAVREAGLEPIIKPIRGGTDGARLSFEGLPCPNLGTGGCAFHGPYEHITVEGMDKAVEIMLGIVRLYQE
ncbi:MAG: peptidase T [Clostridia bacterium]|nr:peptidase T [Clostridia bacterium]